MIDSEVDYFWSALNEIVLNYAEWKNDYIYNPKKNEFEHRSRSGLRPEWLARWFQL